MAWRLRAGIDLLRTLPCAYWEERHSFRPTRPALTAGLVTLLLVYTWVVVATSLQPRIYLASARVLIPPLPDRVLLLGQSTSAPADPFLLQAEFERILALDSLLAVARDLDLSTRLAPLYQSDAPLDPTQVAQILRLHLEVRPIRLTRLVEIRSFFQDPLLGAEVANRVAEEYLRRRRAADPSLNPMMVDLAEPGLRPIAPNVPLNLVVAIPASVTRNTPITLPPATSTA